MSKRNKNRARRESTFANQRLPMPARYVTLGTNHLTDLLRSYEDRRSWQPTANLNPFRAPATFSGQRAPLTSNPPLKRSLRSSFHHKIAFQEPESVLVCVRRQIRKEVLFAKNKTGRTGQNKPRWTDMSKISCRRSK